MRKILGFGVVLAVASLTGTARVAYGQPGTGNIVTSSGSLVTAPGNSEQAANAAAAAYRAGTRYPGAANMTTYSSNYIAPGYEAGTYPGPGTGATPGYTSRVMPGMTGYNDINPMATTMAPGYYYAGTGGMPYATYNTPGYSSMYVTPGSYNTQVPPSSMYVTPGSYNTQVPPYAVRPRRDLVGSGRRNRVVYPASPYGSGYGTSPYGYNTYGNTPYSPYGYSTYGTTTYSTVPGTSNYSTPPY
jgi:hypothetical protein